MTITIDLQAWLDLAKENMLWVWIGGGFIYAVITILIARCVYRNVNRNKMECATAVAIYWPFIAILAIVLLPIILLGMIFERLVKMGNE